MRTKLFAALGALVVIGALAAHHFGWIGKPPLRVGVLLPLSGPQAAAAAGQRNAIQLAVDQRNEQGGVQGRKVRLVVVDAGSTPQQAGAGGRQLYDDPSIVATIGPTTRGDYEATKEADTITKTPRVIFWAPSLDKIEIINPNESRLMPMGNWNTRPIAAHIWNVLKLRKYLWAYDLRSRTGRDLIFDMRSALTEADGTTESTGSLVIAGNDFDISPGSTDFTKLVEQAKRDGTELVYFGTDEPRQAGLAVAALRTAGFAGTFVYGSERPSQEFIDAAQGKAEGALMSLFGPPAEDVPYGREFLKAYQARGFREPPDFYSLPAYIATQALLSAMEKSFLTRASIGGALRNEHKLDTAAGPIGFNFFGSNYGLSLIYQVKQGKWTPVMVGQGFEPEKLGVAAPYRPQ